MTVSLRRPLVAGTVAAVSATAVAVMPAVTPERLAQALATSTSQVSLAAWHNPFEQILGSLEIGQNYLFGAYYNGADAPTPVTAVTTDAINAVALPNVADALVQLPALKQSVTSAKGGQGLTIGSQLNLRNIGSCRTARW